MRVLVIEDEPALAGAVACGLRQAGLAVDLAFDGEEGLEKSGYAAYDVVVLDRDLPVMHGDDVCRRMLAAGGTATPRILMLTASGSLDDRIAGLTIGADDYLPKPFAMRELIARIQALARRPGTTTPPTLVAGDLVVDPARRTAARAGHDLRLTRKEFGVLEMLLVADGRVVSAEELLEHVWDEHADPFTNAVRITMMTLRRKLGTPPLIETIVGVGYRI